MGIDMLYLIGAGGHCKVVIDALRSIGLSADVIRVRDGNPARSGQMLMGFGIETPDLASELSGELFHLAIGDCRVRAHRYRDATALGAVAHTIVHPKAVVAASAQIGAGSFVTAGALVGPEAKLGRCVIVNHGAVVDHDCVVGDFSHVAPNATLGGGVEVGDGVLIGSGAVVLPALRIGAGATIGAGAVVTRDVTENQVWVGNPASERK